MAPSEISDPFKTELSKRMEEKNAQALSVPSYFVVLDSHAMRDGRDELGLLRRRGNECLVSSYTLYPGTSELLAMFVEKAKTNWELIKVPCDDSKFDFVVTAVSHITVACELMTEFRHLVDPQEGDRQTSQKLIQDSSSLKTAEQQFSETAAQILDFAKQVINALRQLDLFHGRPEVITEHQKFLLKRNLEYGYHVADIILRVLNPCAQDKAHYDHVHFWSLPSEETSMVPEWHVIRSAVLVDLAAVLGILADRDKRAAELIRQKWNDDRAREKQRSAIAHSA